ncbi:hypothetical protein J5751_04905 [bacterium]|nr:hypothetical protein [bacterium]
MANQIINQTKQDIETLIANIYTSVDNDTTYQIQNMSNSNINIDIINNNDTTNTQTCALLPFQTMTYKHKDDVVVKLYNDIMQSYISITILGE